MRELILLTLIAACYADLPRGVPITAAPFYKFAEEFSCIDGSLRIPFNQVNDDYCDCPDGSDEPGTSACANGRFFCVNDGHASSFLPSSRVNDKICDCCDGSDEWGSGVQCPNICYELGRAAREESERRAAIARKGWAARKEFAQKGREIKAENEAKLIPLKAQKADLEPKKTEHETRKNDAEKVFNDARDAFVKTWEAERDAKKRALSDRLFDELDVNKDEKLTADDIKASLAFDSNKDGIIDDGEVQDALKNSAEVTKEAFFKDLYESVKITISFKDEESKEAAAEDLDNWDSEKNLDEEPSAESQPPPAEEAENKPKTFAEKLLAEDEEISKMPELPQDIKALEADRDKAREEFQTVSSEYNDIERQISEAESFLNQDYGIDGAWIALKGECFELTEGQYIYKYCPFDRTIQKDKNGHGETRLGEYIGWTGKEPRKYSEQMYEKGQQCWNGPQRSTKVLIECGEENTLLAATEPAKCEYQFVFHTPAACNNPDAPEPHHSEL